MKFKTVQEAFNHYRTATLAEIEKRSADIKAEIQSNANADIESLNIEADGLKEAKKNIEERAAADPASAEQRSQWNPVTRMTYQPGADQNDGDIFGSREYRSAFVKTMLNQPLKLIPAWVS